MTMKFAVALKKAVNHPLVAIHKKVRRKKEKKVSKARLRLQTLISAGWPLPREHHDEVVRILQKKPALAAEVFQENISGHATSPVSYLIGGGATLEIIKEVYKLCPDVIHRPWPDDTYPPLMGACHSGVKDEVILFLVKEFPGALYKEDFEGSLPIHIYMRRSPNGPSLEVVKAMVELYPESIIIDDKVGWGLSPVDYALRMDFDIRILEHFVEHWPKQENDYGLFWDSQSDDYPDIISFERVKVLTRLLPQLDFFHSFIDEWTSEGLIHVIDQLRTNDSVVDVCMRIPCQLMVNDSNVAKALVRFIKENKNIKRLTLLGTRRGKRGEDVVDDSYLNDILDAIASNPRIEDLNLSDFTLQNGDKINEYFTGGKAPRALTFTDFTVKDPWNKETAPRQHCCVTEKLTFSYCNLYTPFYQGFLTQLPYIPALKELNILNSATEHNVTNLLVNCLKKGALENIKVKGYNVTTKRIAEALKTNKTLIWFQIEHAANIEWKRKVLANVLQEHNTTIKYVELLDKVAKYGPEGQKIMYYAMLNKYGRGQIRHVKSGKEFVENLDFVNNDDSLHEYEVQNALYGLLREHPSLWSTPYFPDTTATAPIEPRNENERKSQISIEQMANGRIIIDI